MERESFLNSVEEKDERLEALKKLYPEIFSDGKINLDAFMDATGTSLLPEDEDKTPGYYGLYWPGKRAAKQLAYKSPTGTLKPVKGDGIDEDTTHNIYIEGDNLEVLRTIRSSYRNRIKVIYIDPPYNTGSDFIYPDNYAEPMEAYLKFTGQIDDNGKKLVSNTKSSGSYHRNWLSMIYSRLLVARELLTEDGVIFISIDDNEQANLKIVCDDIFGEENFVTTIAVKMSEPTGVKMAHETRRLPKLKEYVLMYTKSAKLTIKPQRIPKDKWDDEYKTLLNGITEEEISYIKQIRDNEERNTDEINKVNKILSKVTYVSLSETYKANKITSEEDKLRFNYENAWRIIQTVSTTGNAKLLADDLKNKLKQVFFSIQTTENKMYFIKGDYSNDVEKPRIKILFADDYLTVNTCDFWQDIKTTGLDNEGDIDFKNGKKPLKLIKRILDMVTKPNDIVMDFFSGSATTAEAVFQINSETSRNLKFILVQLPVSYDKSLETVTGDSKKQIQNAINFLDSIQKPHTICETGKERIRRASRKAKEIDKGFKVYRLVDSNFKKYISVKGQNKQALEDVISQLESIVDPLVDGWTPENVLEEIKLRQGFALDCKVEEVKDISTNKVLHLIDNVLPITLYVCLDNKINPKTVNDLNIGKDDKFICLNSAIDDTTYARLSDKNRIQTL